MTQSIISLLVLTQVITRFKSLFTAGFGFLLNKNPQPISLFVQLNIKLIIAHATQPEKRKNGLKILFNFQLTTENK